MIKAKEWNGKDLTGIWKITYKLDGVRVLVKDGIPHSRDGKFLYGIPCHVVSDGDYEVFYKSFDKTVSIVRSHYPEIKLSSPNFYSLDPLDPRLKAGVFLDPTVKRIKNSMNNSVALGHEGIVLRKGDTWLKVKPIKTFDVPVLGIIEGKGKNIGKAGSLITEMGKVGTGFTDKQREDLWKFKDQIMGRTIEVACMELTKNGKFRHPRFKHFRIDK